MHAIFIYKRHKQHKPPEPQTEKEAEAAFRIEKPKLKYDPPSPSLLLDLDRSMHYILYIGIAVKTK